MLEITILKKFSLDTETLTNEEDNCWVKVGGKISVCNSEYGNTRHNNEEVGDSWVRLTRGYGREVNERKYPEVRLVGSMAKASERNQVRIRRQIQV